MSFGTSRNYITLVESIQNYFAWWFIRFISKKTSPQLSWLWAALNGITSGGRYLYGKQNKRVTFLYNNQALLQIAFSEQREEAPVKILLTKVI